MPSPPSSNKPQQYSHPKRWYDNDPNMQRGVATLLAMPVAIQMIMAEVLVVISDTLFQTESLMKNLKSLGPAKILALHKAKNKRRDYDKIPIVHKAMTYLSILPAEGLREMGKTLVEMQVTIHDYITACQESGRPVTPEEMRTILMSYAQGGKSASVEYIEAVRQGAPLPKTTGKQSHAISETEDVSNETTDKELESVDSDEGGMRIRLDNFD